MSALDTLKERYAEVVDINAAIALLHWDQEVYMPPKGADARGKQLATLSALSHRQFTDPQLGALLKELEADASLAGDDRLTVQEMRHDYDLATKLPESFVAELAEEQSKAYQAWTKARAESRFAIFLPRLEKIVELQRRKADYLGYNDTPYDALLDEYERGMTTAFLRELFGGLAEKQSALLQRIAREGKPGAFPWLDQEWDETAQSEITLRVLKDIGFDFDAGRQDKSVHPFTTNFDLHDVRVTTRFSARELFSALTGSIHEGGHALYEQGFLESDRRTVLGQAISLGIHESQSRLWENKIGRSLPFWQHYTPLLREYHGAKLDGVSAEDIYRAINVVEPSFIRVEADEATYNMHIILRFEIEQDLIEGKTQPDDLPAIWNRKMEDYLGIVPRSDAEGVLQDVHWSFGAFGYFPTYTLGNLYSVQFFEQATREIPHLEDEIAAGQLLVLRRWLEQKIHRWGRMFTPAHLAERITGSTISPDPFLHYVEKKYGELYQL